MLTKSEKARYRRREKTYHGDAPHPKRFGLVNPLSGFRGSGLCCRVCYHAHTDDSYQRVRSAFKRQMRAMIDGEI